MNEPDHHAIERRADHEVREAVDNIQQRFLDRVGDRIARGLSLRELSEELIVEALRLSEASYGYVLRAENPEKLVLDAVVSTGDKGNVSRSHSTLLKSKPDQIIDDVITFVKPTFSNQASKAPLQNLPDDHPAIRNYAICPIHENGDLKALLVILNTRKKYDLILVKRVQSMLDAFIRVHLNSILSQGINKVIAGVGQINQQLHNLLEASFNAILTTDENLIITAFNPASEQLFGVNTQSALGTSLAVFLTREVLDCVQQHAADYSYCLHTTDKRPHRLGEVCVMRADTGQVPAELNVFHSRINEGVYTTWVLNNISGRFQSVNDLHGALEQYRTLAQLAPVGIVKLDDQWLCNYANDMWCTLTDRSLEENLGDGWIEGIDADDQSQALDDMRRMLTQNETYRQVVRLNRNGGNTVWASINANALRDTLGKLTGVLVVSMDITEQHETEQQFKQIANHDALTGLPNRNQFLEHLHRSVKQRSTFGIVCLMFVDIDGFKAVNDTLGHDAGDELLQQVAHRLKQTVHDEDAVARLGGDEFTVTLTRLEQGEDACAIADAIVHAIKQPFLLAQEEVYVSASIGIAMTHGLNAKTTADANSLIKQADIALYRAKLSGRSRHVFFTPELDQAQRDRAVLITSLRRAVDRQDFELFYQPQLLIEENRLLGFEALLRWPQDKGPHINPGAFIDVLEETGLIGDLGEWAISQACGQHRIWLRRGLISPATTMSVNVSARQLSTPNFADRVSAILQRHSMRPDSLILELTESALVQTIETNIINDIKALGIQISLDDFGTGYSSLAYLSQLPLDHLKIDRSFIADIERFPHAITVVKSIIALSNTLGIRVIAEGVESASVLPLLAAEGCEGYQGFYFSEPLPAREMAAMLQSLEPVRLSHYANFIDLELSNSAQAPTISG